MGQDNPWLLAGLGLFGLVVARWWWFDYQAARLGEPPKPGAFPGATPVGAGVILLACTGALVLLAAETTGEILLGISEQQSRVTVLFGAYSLVAAVIEELIFRGYVVATQRGRGTLIASIVAASALFALLHPFLWEWRDGQLLLSATTKGWFSTGAVFLGSIWFYALRFLPQNPRRSLLPCFAAHLTKNLGVLVIKAVQGHLGGWW